MRAPREVRWLRVEGPGARCQNADADTGIVRISGHGPGYSGILRVDVLELDAPAAS